METVQGSEVYLWINESLNGDRDAFARIVAKYQAMVCSTTFSFVGDLQQSEDLAQETFLIAWKKLGELSEPDKLGNWLRGIARNLAKNWLRANSKNPLRTAAEINCDDVPANQQQKNEQAALVWKALAAIPEKYREPLVLFYREGESIHEISQTLGVSEGCLKQRLIRGRKYLKSEMERLICVTFEAIRPDAAFTWSVVASLPALTAASTTVILAGSTNTAFAAGTSSGTTTSGTAGGLAGLALSINWFVWSLLGPVFVFVCVFFGVWKCIQNSPTLKTRRFMLQSAMGWFSLYWGVMFLIPSISIICEEYIPSVNENIGPVIFLTILLVPIMVVGYSCFAWKRILENEINSGVVSFDSLEQTSLSWKNLSKQFWASLVFSTAIQYFVIVCTLVGLLDQVDTTDANFWSDLLFTLAIFSIPGLISLVFFTIIRRAFRICKDEQSLRNYPCSDPTLLERIRAEIQTERPGKTWRFLFDMGVMLVIAFGMEIMHPYFVKLAKSSEYYTVQLFDFVFLSTVPLIIAIIFSTLYAGRTVYRLKGYSLYFLYIGISFIVFHILGNYGIIFDVRRLLTDPVVICYAFTFFTLASVFGLAYKNTGEKTFTECLRYGV